MRREEKETEGMGWKGKEEERRGGDERGDGSGKGKVENRKCN